MAWIRVVGEEEAGEELRTALEAVRGKRGKLSNIMAVHSLRPDAMTAHVDLYMATMFGASGLTREERETIALVVSGANHCPYCIQHHAEALKHYWRDEERIARLIDDHRSADVSPKMLAILDYAVELTERPYAVEEADVERLRREGLSDEEILSVNLIVSYFNFVNRIVLGLGIAASEEEISGYKY